MKRLCGRCKGIAALSVAATLAPTALAAPFAKAAVILSPLTAKEIRTGVEAGLGCDFSNGKNTYFVIVEGEALLKPGGVLQHIKLDDERSLSIINYGGSIGDRDLRVLIDRDDRMIQSSGEATVREARMTVRQNGAEKTLTGTWTCSA